MNAEIKAKYYKALDETEAKWRAKGVMFDIDDVEECPLCVEFRDDDTVDPCRNCPVFLAELGDGIEFVPCNDILYDTKIKQSRHSVFDAIRKMRKWVDEQ